MPLPSLATSRQSSLPAFLLRGRGRAASIPFPWRAFPLQPAQKTCCPDCVVALTNRNRIRTIHSLLQHAHTMHTVPPIHSSFVRIPETLFLPTHPIFPLTSSCPNPCSRIVAYKRRCPKSTSRGGTAPPRRSTAPPPRPTKPPRSRHPSLRIRTGSQPRENDIDACARGVGESDLSST